MAKIKIKKHYKGPERRRFIRLDYVTPIAYKVCKKQTVSKMLEGYTTNISPAGVLCNIKDKVKKNDLIWLSFDRNTLNICENLEKRSFIYQNGVIGKVVRIESRKDKTYDIGIQFVTREEKNSSYIYPKVYFLKNKAQAREEDLEDETEEYEGKDDREPEVLEEEDQKENLGEGYDQERGTHQAESDEL